MPDPTITDQLRALLPEDAINEDLSAALDRVASLEHEHAATIEQARIERAFLERAPREGLLYPGDALKLDDVLPKLREAEDIEQGLGETFQRLRTSRPYLFSQAPSSPANRKLAEADPDAARNGLRHGSLTRQVQEMRRRKR